MGDQDQLVVTERLVWWKHPPKLNQTDAEIEWGFLQFYDNGTYAFIDERPTDDEIRTRTSCLLRHDSDQEVTSLDN